MADVRIKVPTPISPAPSRQAVLICGAERAVLPWWPTEIAWSAMAQNWSEQQRPGRAPLLVKESQTLPEIAIGFIAENRPTTYVGDGGSVLPLLKTIERMAQSDTPVQLILAARDGGRFRITDYAITELEHDGAGEPIKAEVSLTIKRAQDASAPIGPVPARKRKKGKG